MSKPKLTTKKETFNTIDSNDFDDFVNKVYGGNYEFVAYHEANNYSSYDFNVPNMTMLFGDDAERIRKGKHKLYETHKLFKVLHEDGFIKTGKYIVKVFW